MSKRVFASSWSTSGRVCGPVMSRRLVSGYRVFYGSGKSSFTKYLGFALDPNRKVAGKPFIELLSDRLNSVAVKAELRSLVTQHPRSHHVGPWIAATGRHDDGFGDHGVILESAAVGRLLEREKIAELEFKLDAMGRYDAFQAAYPASSLGKGMA